MVPKLVAAAMATMLLTPALAGADEMAIKARKSVMTLYGFSMSSLGAMAKGEAEYDAEQARMNAENLLSLAKLNSGAMWPAGTDNAAYPDLTRALPAIWETYPAVSEKQKVFTDAATQLASVAGDGLDAMRAAFGPVGKSCGGCHTDFRAEKKK